MIRRIRQVEIQWEAGDAEKLNSWVSRTEMLELRLRLERGAVGDKRASVLGRIWSENKL